MDTREYRNYRAEMYAKKRQETKRKKQIKLLAIGAAIGAGLVILIKNV